MGRIWEVEAHVLNKQDLHVGFRGFSLNQLRSSRVSYCCSRPGSFFSYMKKLLGKIVPDSSSSEKETSEGPIIDSCLSSPLLTLLPAGEPCGILMLLCWEVRLNSCARSCSSSPQLMIDKCCKSTDQPTPLTLLHTRYKIGCLYKSFLIVFFFVFSSGQDDLGDSILHRFRGE